MSQPVVVLLIGQHALQLQTLVMFNVVKANKPLRCICVVERTVCI